MFEQVLAKKMTVLYKLAKEQLSKQYHYDFGLRALKSVLVMAGELKRGAAELPEVRGSLCLCQSENIAKICGPFILNVCLSNRYAILTSFRLCKRLCTASLYVKDRLLDVFLVLTY